MYLLAYGCMMLIIAHNQSHTMHTVPRILDILILQDKTLCGALEASNIVCWLVNQPIAKLDLFKSPDCRWICETYVEYCFWNSATVRRLVQSPTLQSTISCRVHSDSRGKGIRVSPAWRYESKLDGINLRLKSRKLHGSFRVKSTTGGPGHLSDLAQINF